MSDSESVVLTLPASWETFWRMVALIVTDVFGETNNRFDPLVKWIYQDSLIQRESVVRMPLTSDLLTPTLPPNAR